MGTKTKKNPRKTPPRRETHVKSGVPKQIAEVTKTHSPKERAARGSKG